ncbi:hypothetical protein J6590_093350 [Homalodisca vitripennis]|nr:hypothetical protein J6590_093350 [Homalodisca vitripennis]
MVVGEQVKGEVMLIDVENKDVLHSITVSDDVSCLVWLQEKQFHNYHLLTASTHSQMAGLRLEKWLASGCLHNELLTRLPTGGAACPDALRLATFRTPELVPDYCPNLAPHPI